MSQNRKVKKSHYEVQNYKKNIKSLYGDNDSTYSNYNRKLVGTDEISEYDGIETKSKKEEIKKKKLIYRITDTMKDHILDIGVGAIILPFCIWLATNIFGVKSDINLINYRVSNIEAEIKTIVTDYSTREILELQLDNIKKEIENEWRIDINEISNKISLIESQLELINDFSG